MLKSDLLPRVEEIFAKSYSYNTKDLKDNIMLIIDNYLMYSPNNDHDIINTMHVKRELQKIFL